MQIQTASIPFSTPNTRQAVNPNTAAVENTKTEPVKPSNQKADAQPQTQDIPETAKNTQFAPVSQPFAQTDTNRAYSTNQEGGSGNRGVNLYQQIAQQGQSQPREDQAGLFGIDVYV